MPPGRPICYSRTAPEVVQSYTRALARMARGKMEPRKR